MITTTQQVDEHFESGIDLEREYLINDSIADSYQYHMSDDFPTLYDYYRWVAQKEQEAKIVVRHRVKKKNIARYGKIRRKSKRVLHKSK